MPASLVPPAFCTPSDVDTLGVPNASLVAGAITSQVRQACCDAANGMIAARIAGRYEGINRNGGAGYSWGPEVTLNAVFVAQKYMLDKRGRTPNPVSADKLVDDNYKAAMDWVHLVESQAIHPQIQGGEIAGETSQGPVLISASASRTNSHHREPNRRI